MSEPMGPAPESTPVVPGAGAASNGTDDALSQLRVVEVTTVTTVQGSSGIFLSPHPQQQRPTYVEGAAPASARSAPSAELNRAKVDTALLFHGASADGLRIEIGLAGIKPQHYFPAIREDRWPILLGRTALAAEPDAWTEWGGWRAYGGAAIEAAPAATLDYELAGLEAPLVVSAEDEAIVVTNRSEQTIAKTLLVYSHAGGIGIRVVDSLGPGMRRLTATGPKEQPLNVLLAAAREQLESFFGDVTGPELARALAHAKSIPFLETPGLRLIYMLDEAVAPRPVVLPARVAEHRRFVVAQAEVLAPTEEAHVVSLLRAGALRAADVPLELGRFSHAKLEVAAFNDESVEPQAQQLLDALE